MSSTDSTTLRRAEYAPLLIGSMRFTGPGPADLSCYDAISVRDAAQQIRTTPNPQATVRIEFQGGGTFTGSMPVALRLLVSIGHAHPDTPGGAQ